ncbi:MAG: response regulator transcription factor [Candidatus Acidiferrum sp.]
MAVISARLADGPLTGFDAFRGGARGIFCRDSSFENLTKCIRQVHEGHAFVSPLELDFLLDLVISTRPLKVQPSRGMARLTSRERDVVHLVADGMRNQDIADKLELSEHTVRNYLLRIYDKLGISSRVELVLYAVSSTEAIAAPANSMAHSASA